MTDGWASMPLQSWGDPYALEELAVQCRAIAKALRDAAEQVRPGSSVMGWHGEAAQAFAEAVRVVPRDLSLAAASYSAVGQALTAYAGGLEPLLRWRRPLEAEVEQLQRQRVTPCDPMQKAQLLMQEAELRGRLGRLRAEAQDLALQCQRRVLAATDPPHQRPGWFGRAVDDVGDWIEENAQHLDRAAEALGVLAMLAALIGCVPGLQAALAVAAAMSVAALAIRVALASRGRATAGEVLVAAAEVVPAVRGARLAARTAEKAVEKAMTTRERLREGVRRYEKEQLSPEARANRPSETRDCFVQSY